MSHRNDVVSCLLKEFGPENCRIYTIENLTVDEASAVEALLQRLISGTTMHIGQQR